MLLLMLLLCTPIHRSITITIILVSLCPINQSIDRKSNSQIIFIKQQTTKNNIEWLVD